MPRPIQATIYLDALRHNYARIKAVSVGARAFAVVKAAAYGHGVDRVAVALPQADGFATLEIESALALRKAGIRQPILLLEGVFDQAQLQCAAEYDLWLTVHEPQAVMWLEQAVLKQPVQVFLKLNTGMNRLGFPAAEASGWVARLQACTHVAGITLMTHFACADEPAKGIAAQLAAFEAAVAGLNLPTSLANSAAIFAYPETHRDWVRAGIALYGGSPLAGRSAAELDLLPAMSLTSAIIGVQELAPGAAVGYGALFVAEQPMRIGIVACGYADGYPRHAGTGTPVLVGGVRTRLLGRVSMDMLAVDLSALPQAGIGTIVELWGQGLPIDEVAAATGTIAYELMCAVAPRVPVLTRPEFGVS